MPHAIPWWNPRIGEEEHALIAKVLSESYPNEGKLSTLFEQKIAERIGAKHAIAVTNGTSALFLSLKALGIGPGDEVIVPDMTFIATANAVSLCGAAPVLVDVDPTTLTISVDACREAITKKTKAVIPVHVTGRGADMHSFIDLAESKGLFIVEDAAEAFMSKHKGEFLGTFGSMGCFSFSPNKIITTGQGGMIVTDDDELHVSLRALKDQGRPTKGSGGDDIHPFLGFNFKFTDLQAAVGLGQLSYLDMRMRRLVRNHEIYVEHLSSIKRLALLPFDTSKGELPLWTDGLFEERNKLVKHLLSKNMDSRKIWHPIHTQKPYRTEGKNFPNSSSMSPKALWLPSAYSLSDEDIVLVSEEIKNFYS